MSLSLAYNIARGSLAANSATASVISRNIANADNPNASLKSAHAVTTAIGGVSVSGIDNAVDNLLLGQAVESASAKSESDIKGDALKRLQAIFGDTNSSNNPVALLGKLRNSLVDAAAAPQDLTLAQSVVLAASNVVGALNDGASLITSVRTDADVQLQEGLSKLDGMLRDFQSVNEQIINGTAQKRDVSDDVDRRNALLHDIAGLVDVRTSVRGDNDMVLFLANGATLFETTPRKLSMNVSGQIAFGQPGGTLSVDGWPIAPKDALGGKLGGLLAVRDEIGLTLGRQLDEIARGLIEATKESDQSAAPSSPDLAGLFTYSGGPTVPPAGVLIDGLAQSIRVNANVDPSQGGLLARLRDGGISDPGDPAYVYNASGVAGFSDRLQGIVDSLSAGQSYDAAADLPATSTDVLTFAARSAGWFEDTRASNQASTEDNAVSAERSLAAWQNRIGISIDSEMTNLIALEKSYQASSRLITTVNSMFDALLRAVG